MSASDSPMSRAAKADAWRLACRLFAEGTPALIAALSGRERSALAWLTQTRAARRHVLDLRFALCPYCQLHRGPVTRATADTASGLVCYCPDCGDVSLDVDETGALQFDAGWLIRKLRGALGIPASQPVVPLIDGVWRIGTFRSGAVVLARHVEQGLRHSDMAARAGIEGAGATWLLTPKPLRDAATLTADGLRWWPLEERFALYGDVLRFLEPGAGDDETMHAPVSTGPMHGPFSEDFRHVHLPDWPHGPITLSKAQSAVFQALWHFRGEAQDGHRIMNKAGCKSDKPIDVFKVKAQHKGDLRYEGPLQAYQTLVITDRHAGTYALPCARHALTTAPAD